MLKGGIDSLSFSCACLKDRSHDSAFIPWANEVRMHVMQHFPLGKGLEPIPGDVLLEPQWLLSLSEEKHEKVDSRQKDKVRASDDTPNGTAVSKALSGDSQYVELCLESNERLTPKTHWQDVRKLTFLTSARVEYLPGDVLTIFPRNATEDVDHIIQLMNWHDVADRSIEFRSNPKCSVTTNSLPPNSIYLPIESITLRRVLTELVDLNAIPGRHFFGQLAHFTQYEAQRDRLSEFSNPEYLDELYDYTTRPRRSVLEVLQEFNTVKLPWQWVAEILPALRGRQFSIASGGKLKAGENDSTRFELLVAIVKYRTVIRKLRRGVCTRYLEGLQAGDSLRALLQKGGLNITRNDLRRPILMVGPGTGVAPIRSLIWQRLAWNNEIMEQQGRITGSSELSQGDNVLFFGCRNRHADYFFKHEWTELQKHFSLRVFAAFSRDQGKTQYVQDLIRQHSRVVHNLIYEQHGTVFVCGSSGKMPQAVREALVAVLEKEALLDQEAAEIYIKLMEKEDRYKQETW